MTRQPATDGGDGTIEMQGYGYFQAVDVIMKSSGGMLEMPPAAGEALRQEGFLYLEQRFTGGRHNISARVNTQKLRSPFHLTCTLPDDAAPPGIVLDLHVQSWRRFLELPVDHMLAVRPDMGHRGRFRVGVWLMPEMSGPHAARLVALHAQYHVGVLGFHEEQVYMHPHQMAHSLRDADISEMVDRGQLKLIYIDSSPELSTSCSKAARDYLTDSSISVDEELCTQQIAKYSRQVLVNAHIMLANVGGDAYVFNCDVDEFLVTDNRTTLTELSEGCFRNESADLPRIHALCTDCEEKNMSDIDLWMDRTRKQHPLVEYRTLISPANRGLEREQPKWMIKPDDIWSIDVHGAIMLEGHKCTSYEDVQACGARILHVYNMFRKRAGPRWRSWSLNDGAVTYLWPLQDQQGG